MRDFEKHLEKFVAATDYDELPLTAGEKLALRVGFYEGRKYATEKAAELVEALERIEKPCTGSHLIDMNCDGCRRPEIASETLRKFRKQGK